MIIEARILTEKYVVQKYMRWSQPPHVTMIYDFKEDKETIGKLLKEMKKYDPTFMHVDGSDVKKTDGGWMAYLKIVPSKNFIEMKYDLLKHIRNFSSTAFQEYSYGDFYHITLCKCKKKKFCKKCCKESQKPVLSNRGSTHIFHKRFENIW